MRNSLYIIALLVCSITVSGQTAQSQNPEDETNNKTLRFKGQIGINATDFIKQFIVLNNAAVTAASPYDFNAKAFIGWSRFPSLLIGPRIGFGYRFSHQYSNNEQQNNERSTDSKSRSARVGLELQQAVSKRWVVYYGIDYINSSSSTSTVTVSSVFNPNPPFGQMAVRTDVTTNNKTTGFGPVLGIQFNLNKHICLGTEASFYYQQSKGGDKIESSNPNNTIPETFNDATNTAIRPPFFINCNIVF